MSNLDTTINQQLAPLIKPSITQEQLRLYSEASGDYNPIHLDEQAARQVGLDGVIAHGMLSMAFLGQFVNQQIANIPGASIEKLKVRFHNMVGLGDTLTCHGKVTTRTTNEDLSRSIAIECWAQNQKGDKATIGEAVVIIPAVSGKEVKV
ncbi:MAG TPA: MaoC/PaaZ C-terminal domain-containing protein [Ktedonobacteraceae bacterium]|nr:MaoC/PaaZ C-terminal domain-containing protein [Ktedonobacteraceae bacterium]